MQKLPLPLQTLFAELDQQAAAVPADVRIGSVKRQAHGGRLYLKAEVTVGRSRRTEHIGPADDPKAHAHAQAVQFEMNRAKERRKLVAMLRQAMPAPTADLGRVLDALADAGLFRQGAVLIGTAAFQCYSPLVGAVLPAAAATTQDADIATADLALSADLALGDEPTSGVEQALRDSLTRANLLSILQRADPTFADNLAGDGPPASFRAASGFMVDVVPTPRRHRHGRSAAMPALQAGAMPLPFINWLITDPTPTTALWAAGVRVLVPEPARYAIGKLILAQRRGPEARLKRGKDLAQAQALIEALDASDPFRLADLLADARRRGATGWRQPIDRSLAEIDRAR